MGTIEPTPDSRVQMKKSLHQLEALQDAIIEDMIRVLADEQGVDAECRAVRAYIDVQVQRLLATHAMGDDACPERDGVSVRVAELLCEHERVTLGILGALSPDDAWDAEEGGEEAPYELGQPTGDGAFSGD